MTWKRSGASSGPLADADGVEVDAPKTRSEHLQRLIDSMFALFGTGASINSMLWNSEPNNKATARTLRKPFEGKHLAMHIEGRARVGAIPRTTATGSHCQWVCIDLDVNRDPVIPEATAIAAVAALRDSLRGAGITPWIERSKSRGWHVWVFFDGPVPVEKTASESANQPWGGGGRYTLRGILRSGQCKRRPR